MKIKNYLLVGLLVLLGACTCGTKAGNIPYPTEGTVLKDINYSYDSFALDSEATARLQSNYQWLKANPGSNVVVEGHCDERGTNEYNLVLGANRAKAAYEYLKSLGMDANRASTISYGEELPLDPGHNEAAWYKNRRVHFDVQ